MAFKSKKGTIMKSLIFTLLVCCCASMEAIQANGNNIKSIIANNPSVVLDVYADGCPPCNQLAPVFQAVEGELSHSHTFVKLNGRQDPQVTSELNIRGFPTLIFFKNGHEVGRQTGYVNHSQLKHLINSYLQ